MRTVYNERIGSIDPRLKRHIMHDSESRRFAFNTQGLTVASKTWPRAIPILDQGSIGSCTGNAGVGALGTDPAYGALSSLVSPAYSLDEAGALALYSDAETVDGDGPYPPNDYGSSGLSIAKALKTAGMISGYQWTFSLGDALKALSATPWICGVYWYDSMFNPDASGHVTISGNIAGGHEFICREINAEAEQLWFDNSWGEAWGKIGRFWMSFDDFGKLLSQQGDVTILLPLSAPEPSPAPIDPDQRLAAALRTSNWVMHRHVGITRTVANAAKQWLADKGL